MKKEIVLYWFVSAINMIAFQTTGFSQIQNPDSATVTFKVNTAFVQDTVTEGSLVSIRGSVFGGDWSFEKGIKLKNIAGDYWEVQKKVPVGSSGGSFKIVTLTESGLGWDRHQIAEFEIEKDTTLTLFTTGLKETYTDPFTGASVTRGDDWNPLELAKKGDTSVFAVHFRVNMEGIRQFNLANHTVTVRGGFNGWSAADTLKPEVRHDDLTLGKGFYEAEKYFFSKTILIPKASAGLLKYKFVWSDSGAETNWEDAIGGDRTIQFKSDTTLAWKWFDNKGPYCSDCGHPIDFKINFNVDLKNAIKTNGFDPENDKLIARIGYLRTALKTVDIQLIPPQIGTVYTGSTGADSLFAYWERVVFYQYLKKIPGGELEEFFFDYFNEQPGFYAPRYRKLTLPTIFNGNEVVVEDLTDDLTSTHRQPVFRNISPLPDSTSITVYADLRPVYYFVNELGDSLAPELSTNPFYISKRNISELPVRMVINSYCFICIGLPGPTFSLKDDGIWPDVVAGDRIFTTSMIGRTDWDQGIEFSFTIGGQNVESRNLRHLFNLFPQPQNEIKVQFGETDPLQYKNEKGYWDFNAGKGVITSVEGNSNTEKPEKFSISAYPNPFNPATLISYSIPQSGKVSLKVFDLLGRQVALLAEEIKPAGTHQIPFHGDDLSSGIYIVRMESGSKTESVKVILLK
ncbi:MAG: T9SS type A sorting domain-containing protein [Bacteroidetes bacterium]|nr:T9SS type A sorting domain-containing protein [Bacteroidota bacterium]